MNLAKAIAPGSLAGGMREAYRHVSAHEIR